MYDCYMYDENKLVSCCHIVGIHHVHVYMYMYFTMHFFVRHITLIEKGPVCDIKSIDPVMSSFTFVSSYLKKNNGNWQKLTLGSKVTKRGQVRPADIAPGGVNLLNIKQNNLNKLSMHEATCCL